MAALYGKRPIKVSIGLLAITVFYGVGNTQAPTSPGAAGPSPWWTTAISQAFLVRQPAHPSFDPDIGRLLDPELLDSDSRQALTVLQTSYAQLLGGQMAADKIVPGRQVGLQRIIEKFMPRPKAPFQLIVGGKVVKADDLRGFVIKIRSADKILIGEVYLDKIDGAWLYEDIQRFRLQDPRPFGDFSIDHQTELELEGWIPYGD